MTDRPVDVAIIGAGLSGLACAQQLQSVGRTVRVLEASEAPGGRVRTDRLTVDGGEFLVDRGFQVYLTAYPEGRRRLDLDALGLGRFVPGAMVRRDGRFWRLTDPLRSPFRALATLVERSPIVTRKDLAVLGFLDARLRFATEASAWAAPEQRSEDFLREAGLSERVIDGFFRPFFGGVFLTRTLHTSARKLRWIYRMFARGRAALPQAGMQAIPEQLAAGLATDTVRYGQPVRSINADSVEFDDGDPVSAPAVVVATDGAAASVLLPEWDAPEFTSTTTLSFTTTAPPTTEPILYLDGDGTGPVNHLAVVSNAQPSYAPSGHALISANVVPPFDTRREDSFLESEVRGQLREWFGAPVDDWRLLRIDRVERALPSEDAPLLQSPRRPVVTGRPNVFLAGDHLENASINGALACGRRTAETVDAWLARSGVAVQ